MSSAGISKMDALKLLQQYVKKESMIAHSLASEVVMRHLAIQLHQDADKWAIAGLLHDLDVEVTQANAKTHGQVCIQMLREAGVDEEVIDAISMHNEESSGKERSTVFQHALAAGETITGLIIATTLVYPDKKIASIKTKSVVKRMKEKAFAASVKRENILECEKIGIPLAEFAEIAIVAMKTIAEEIGL